MWTVGDVEVHVAVVAGVRSRSEKLKHVRGVPAYSALTIMHTTLKMLGCKEKVQNRVAPAARSKRGERSNSCTQTFGTQHVDLCDRSAGSLELKGHPWLSIFLSCQDGLLPWFLSPLKATKDELSISITVMQFNRNNDNTRIGAAPAVRR